jgi:hypothetical protein
MEVNCDSEKHQNVQFFRNELSEIGWGVGRASTGGIVCVSSLPVFLSSGPKKRARFINKSQGSAADSVGHYTVLVEHGGRSSGKRRLGGPSVKEVKEALLRTRNQ